MATTPGKRVRHEGAAPRLAPGEYCRDPSGRWRVRPPAGDATVGVSGAVVIEHADGTATVRQVLLTPHWSGRLIRGVWEGEVEGPTALTTSESCPTPGGS